MSDPKVVADLIIAACIGIWIYTIGTAIYLIATSNWFLSTWIGKAINELWALIRETIQAILPPYKR